MTALRRQPLLDQHLEPLPKPERERIPAQRLRLADRTLQVSDALGQRHVASVQPFGCVGNRLAAMAPSRWRRIA